MAGGAGGRDLGKKWQALCHFAQLLQLYEHLSPGFVDADTASDLDVICRKALDPDAASEPESGQSPLSCPCFSLKNIKTFMWLVMGVLACDPQMLNRH